MKTDPNFNTNAPSFESSGCKFIIWNLLFICSF